MTHLLGAIYLLALAWLSLYGLLGLVTLWLYRRHRHDTFACPQVPATNWPKVTVQLPIYNERYVVGRLIEAVVHLDYPADRLQIQVIDDSSDDTTEKAAELVRYYKRKGVNISLLRRRHRQGYKAGALAHAFPQADGDFIAIFDADFQPAPDFLRQTIPHFLNEPQLGVIQTRWGHLNAGASPLTAAQAIALDKHFAMEQTVRHRANLFPKFNGAGGVWRRCCLQDAGGWEEDTVCEDLCLSTRAFLKGWRFRFLNDVVAPAELPATINAYKNQQARWAKGSSQCLRKFGWHIMSDQRHSLLARLYALLAMSAYLTHPLLILLLLLQAPLIYLDYHFPSKTLLFALAGIGQPLLFIWGQQTLYSDWRRRLRHLPTLLLVAIGLAPSSSRAIWQAGLGRRHTFIRTPKRGDGDKDIATAIPATYHLPFDWISLVELSLAVYAGFTLVLAIMSGHFGSIFFLALCFLGFTYTTFLNLQEASVNKCLEKWGKEPA